MAATLSLRDARALVLQHADVLLEPENVALLQSLGRRLADEFRADTPWPATDRSAMDGYAVYAGGAGLSQGVALPVVGQSLAGHPFPGSLVPGQAIRIMTGAVVPRGADAVVPVEQTSGYSDREVTLRAAVRSGQNVRPAGSEHRVGDLLLPAGRRIRAAEVGALAVLGIDPVPVFRRPRVAILSTGDEVVPIGRVPQPHQVRDSNAHALAAQVLEAGGVPELLGIAPDASDALAALLARGLGSSDVLLTIGGISEGTHDLVQPALAAQGVTRVFHGIQVKPGKPTYFGVHARAGTKGFVFGLPGNPASCFTVFELLVRPLLERIAGAPDPAAPWSAHPAGKAWRANPRLQAIPAALRIDADGRLLAEVQPVRPSGDPFCLAEADGLALVPEAAEPDPGLRLAFHPYPERRS